MKYREFGHKWSFDQSPFKDRSRHVLVFVPIWVIGINILNHWQNPTLAPRQHVKSFYYKKNELDITEVHHSHQYVN